MIRRLRNDEAVTILILGFLGLVELLLLVLFLFVLGELVELLR